MTSRSAALRGVLFVSLLIVSAPSSASLLMALDGPALVARAERIVVGTVESRASRWIDEGHSAIVTDVRIRVTQAMRGAREGEIITVRRLGGSVDGIGMRVIGEASFDPGEEVLLFSERRGDAYYTVGMSQGKMRITTLNGQKMVQADLQGAELIQAGRGRAAGARPLAEVLREVAELVRRIPHRPHGAER